MINDAFTRRVFITASILFQCDTQLKPPNHDTANDQGERVAIIVPIA